MLDVVVVGNVGIDTNVYLAGNEINFEVEANFTENLDYVGQAGGYATRGFAQLGKALLPVAKKRGCKISCDIQDVVDLNDAYRADFIEYADVLFFSAVNF